MDKSGRIRELLRQITGTDRLTFDFMPMEVKSVNGDLCVCLLDELEIPDVRLAAIPDGSADGLLITPKKGSIVMVADLSAGNLRDLMVVGYTAIESVCFMGGKNGGLVISGNTADKLNVLENDINELKTIFTTWVTVPNDGGAALKTAVSSWAGQQLTPTVATDLENDKIAH